MIVVDTNLIAYFLVEGAGTEPARRVFRKDPSWSAPVLWRSEFRNVLAGLMRRGSLELMEALRLSRQAEGLMRGSEYDVPASPVLTLSASSRCTAYDCEFVALARDLGVSLVTSDAQVLRAFPALAVSPVDFAQG